MTDYTRPATWDDVKTVARYLEEAGAEYALVGGYALAAHGFGRFTEVTLHPVMTIIEAGRIQEAEALHAKAHELCFIANSVNFPVRCSSPVVTAQ